MPSGDAQRTWFPEMIVRLRSEWYQGMSMPALISLRDELDGMLQRIRTGRNIQTLTVPTAANYAGDFRGWTRSGVMAPIYDPGSTRLAPSGSGYVRDLFPNNMIPQNRFSGVATRFIALRPAGMLRERGGHGVPNAPRALAALMGPTVRARRRAARPAVRVRRRRRAQTSRTRRRGRRGAART